jgi:hypothetical protein
MTLPIRFDRRFQLWYFHGPQGELLLRSPMDEDTPTRLDVTFHGVTETRLPRVMHGITIGRPDQQVFSMEADDYAGGYVRATEMSFDEAERYFDELASPLDSERVIRSGHYR